MSGKHQHRPQAKRARKSEVVVTTTRTHTRQDSRKAPKKKQQRARARGSQSTNVRRYADALADPFNKEPPRLIFGSLIPLSQRTAFVRSKITGLKGGSSTTLVVVGSPQSSGVAFRAYRIQATQLDTPLGNITATQITQYYNANSLQALAQSGRVVASGVKVIGGVGALNTPPLWQGGIILDTFQNLQNSTFNQLASLSPMNLIPTQDNGGVQVTWRPTSLGDYNLVSKDFSTDTYPINSAQPLLIILVSGYQAANFDPMVEVVTRLETNAGFDYAGADEAPEGLSGPIEDVMGAIIGILPPPASAALPFSAVIDSAHNAISSHPSSWALALEGGHTPILGMSASSMPASSRLQAPDVPLGYELVPRTPARLLQT